MIQLLRRITKIVTLYRFIPICLGLAVSLPVQAQSPVKPLEVVVSFSILADLTQQVAKERAHVVALVGPNSDAHVYRATPADAKALKEAGLIIVNGLGFEGFMPRLIKSSGTKATVVVASTGVKTIEAEEDHGGKGGHSHGKIDPHAWQSIEAAKTYIANIRDGLSKADPAGAEVYAKNAAAYLAELTALKADLDKMYGIIPPPQRIIVTSHDALAYFGRENLFTLEAVQGVSTDNEPSAKDVARIIRTAREKKARAIFIENMTNPKIAEQIARESGAKIGGTLFSDALSDEKGPAPTYIAMMRHNAKMLVEALRD
ncbi:MAG: ABC transporter substrate-binding protein [Rhizobiales bacterium PAR1]|nr:MAG: ABC transporter substrate-binding protein [Rhizobiales bacterium PAR1]